VGASSEAFHHGQQQTALVADEPEFVFPLHVRILASAIILILVAETPRLYQRRSLVLGKRAYRRSAQKQVFVGTLRLEKEAC
jgi:hypothetical protein